MGNILLDPHVTLGFMLGFMIYTVSDVSRMSGVTVRALHHYDELGLVRPARRSASGYRLYEREDLERLQTVLFYRELGFELARIVEMVDNEDHSRSSALVEQHRLLVRKRDRIDQMLVAVEAALIAEEQGVKMSDEDLVAVFGDFDPSQYEDEVQERWGDTDAYRESARRTDRYTADDWREVKAEAEGIAEAFADLLKNGVDATSDEATKVAERHRRHIDERFYACTKEAHAGLGEMYVNDARFAEYWDQRSEGLAVFVRDAIAANSSR